MDKDISKKIIERIKKDHIAPDPKWKANLAGYMFWSMSVVAVLLCGAFLSLIFFNMSIYDFDLYRQIKIRRFLELLFFSAPYFWMVLFALFFALGYYVFRRTKKGYRYSVVLVGAVLLVAASALGVLAHLTRVNSKLEHEFSRRVPGLHAIAPSRKMRLVAPGRGLLGGIILTLEPNEISLRSFKEENWRVRYDNDTRIKGSREFGEGAEVLVVGKEIGEFFFDAEAIRAFEPGMMRHIPFRRGDPKGGPVPEELKMMRMEVKGR